MKRLFVYMLIITTFILGPAIHVVAMPPAQAVPQAQSVYKIVINTQETNEPVGVGTGWIGEDLAGQVVVVTNSHVCVDDGKSPSNEYGVLMKLKLEDGRPLTKKIFDPFADICILSIDGDASKEKPLHLAKEESKARDPLIVIGHPDGGPLKATIGYRIDSNQIPMGIADLDLIVKAGEQDNCMSIPVEGYCVYFRTSDTLQVEIKPGSSGSPVLNMAGDVIHMIWGHYVAQDTSIAVTLPQLKKYLK